MLAPASTNNTAAMVTSRMCHASVVRVSSVSLGMTRKAGVNGKAEGGGEEPEFDLDDVGDGVVVEPVAGSAEEVVGEPKPGDDLECERGEPDTFEVAFELAHGCGSLSAQGAGETGDGEHEVAAGPHAGAEDVEAEREVVAGHLRRLRQRGLLLFGHGG